MTSDIVRLKRLGLPCTPKSYWRVSIPVWHMVLDSDRRLCSRHCVSQSTAVCKTLDPFQSINQSTAVPAQSVSYSTVAGRQTLRILRRIRSSVSKITHIARMSSSNGTAREQRDYYT